MSYLVYDLERNMFWKSNRRGYTFEPKEAGLYSYEEAKKLVESDIMNHTRMFEKESFFNISEKE